jgi:hypothetical protein
LLSPSIFTVPVESLTNITSALNARFIAVISVNLAVRVAILPFPSRQLLQEANNRQTTNENKPAEIKVLLDIDLVFRILCIVTLYKVNLKT